LRQHFSRSGLHVFKHRKRMQFVSLIRPSPMENGSLSPSVAEILQVIQGKQNCNRASLAAAVLGTDESAVDHSRKSMLATDLHWLVETGRVIEFSDGRMELPLAPAKTEPEKPKTPVAKPPTESGPTETPAEPTLEPVAVPEAASPDADSIPVAAEAPPAITEPAPAESAPMEVLEADPITPPEA